MPAFQNARVAQLVEHHVANVDVASSNLVSRSLLSPVLLDFYLPYFLHATPFYVNNTCVFKLLVP